MLLLRFLSKVISMCGRRRTTSTTTTTDDQHITHDSPLRYVDLQGAVHSGIVRWSTPRTASFLRAHLVTSRRCCSLPSSTRPSSSTAFAGSLLCRECLHGTLVQIWRRHAVAVYHTLVHLVVVPELNVAQVPARCRVHKAFELNADGRAGESQDAAGGEGEEEEEDKGSQININRSG